LTQQKHTILRLKITSSLKGCEKIEVITKEACGLIGYPDLFLCVRGHFVGAEIKIPPDKLTPMQFYRLKRIARAGGSIYIVKPDNWEWFVNRIKEIALVQHLKPQYIEPLLRRNLDQVRD